jgi:chromosome segregation ATPase
MTGNYIYGNKSAIYLLSITENKNGDINGTYYSSILNNDKVTTDNIGIKGQASGNKMTLTIGGVLGSLFGGNISGEKKGNEITLLDSTNSYTFKSSDIKEYNQQSANLQTIAKKNLEKEQAAQQKAQEEQQQQLVAQNQQQAVENEATKVNNDFNDIFTNINNMGTDLNNMETDLNNMKTDLGNLNTDFQNEITDKNSGTTDLSGDANTVQSDVGTLQNDSDSLKSSDEKTFMDDYSSIQKEIDGANADFKQYSTDRDLNQYTPDGAPTTDYMQSEIKKAKNQLSSYEVNMNGYYEQSKQIIAQGQQIADKAKKMAN